MSSHFHFSPRPNRAAEINWQPWSEAAFQTAQADDHPILLAISAVWCHWCHVMDETTYSDPAVIELLNRNFVAIRVDNDLRPDINQRYNLGGWPTTVFLTPEGEILAGGTYLPASDLLGLADRVLQLWSSERQLITDRVAERRQQMQELALTPSPTPPRKEEGKISSQLVEQTLSSVIGAYDQVYGGFGSEPKFPHPVALSFLAEQSILRKQPQLMEMVRHTLRQMAGGGMYDHIEGGFFRYSTTADWSVPHFEKMLEDHAGLISALALAEETQILEDAVRYLDNTLLDHSTGLYGGSQDADEHYYSLSREQRQQAQAPPIDRRIYANWNCQLATAYLEASLFLDLPHLKKRAEVMLTRLFADFFYPSPQGGGVGMQHAEGVGGQLTDQVWALRAATAAFGSGLGEAWRERALQLTEVLEEHYTDKSELGGYLDHSGQDRLGRLAYPVKPLNENSVAAIALWQLHILLGDPASNLADRAQKALAAVIGQGQPGIFAAPLARAIDRLLRTPVKVTTGSLDLARKAVRNNPYAVIEHSVNSPAQICVGTNCFPPTNDPEKLLERVTLI